MRDGFDGQTGARLIATIAMFLSAAPAFAPMIGSLLLRLAGQPATFLGMAAYGLVLLGVTLAFLPETNRNLDPRALQPGRMPANYGQLLFDPAYMRMALVMAMAIGGIYTFHPVSPFVYIDVIGVRPEVFALIMLSSAPAFFSGSRLVRRQLRRRPARKLVPVGLWLMAAGGAGLTLALTVATPSVPGVAMPIMLRAFGAAFLLPGTTIGYHHGGVAAISRDRRECCSTYELPADGSRCRR